MSRRKFLALGVGLWALPQALWAAIRQRTPSQVEGPFYPVTAIPKRTNLLADEVALERLGLVLQLSGRVIDIAGNPLPNIKVEIWQCDERGLYDHPQQQNHEHFSKNFKGAGSTITDDQGGYAFLTMYPVPYTGRPPHIHVKLWRGQTEMLTSQLYLKGKTGNEWFNRGGQEHLQIAPNKEQDGRWSAQFEFVV